MFEFTNGVKSPEFRNGASRDRPFDVMELDITKTIRKVEVYVEGGRGDIDAIKFISDEGEVLGEAEWLGSGSEWKTIDIPEDKEIIGVFGCFDDNHTDMLSLGFNLWTPNPRAI